MDLRRRVDVRVVVVLAGVTALETAFVTDSNALITGLVGGEVRGELEAFEGVPRVERGVGEDGSGKARGWCRVETMTAVCVAMRTGLIDYLEVSRTRSWKRRSRQLRQRVWGPFVNIKVAPGGTTNLVAGGN